jgi:hypothetical protein
MPSRDPAMLGRGARRGQGRGRCGRAATAAGFAGLLAATFVVAGLGIGTTEASTGTDRYALSRLVDGSPAGWRPCRTVTWGLATQGVGVGVGEGEGEARASDVHHAVRLAAEVTGLRFVYVGETPLVPQRGWLAPGGWPAAAPDLVVAWAVAPGDGGAQRSPGGLPTSDLLAGAGEAAVGGWAAEYVRSGGGDAVVGYVTHGYVVLDALAEGKFAPSFVHAQSGVPGARRPLRGRLLLHELGHALGLAHVEDETQVMYPKIGAGQATWGVGDRAGLRAVSGAATSG